MGYGSWGGHTTTLKEHKYSLLLLTVINLPTITQLVNGRARIQTQEAGPQDSKSSVSLYSDSCETSVGNLLLQI